MKRYVLDIETDRELVESLREIAFGQREDGRDYVREGDVVHKFAVKISVAREKEGEE